MEFDQNSVVDYAFVLAPVQLIFVICLTVFHKLKVRWPLKVNCWFCNKNTKIWRQDLDWWLCPSCEQYNGFSKNGDYAYDIPEQYTTSNKYMRYSLPGQSSAANVSNNNLCMDCNERESIKLLEVSNFEPRYENLYYSELKAFKEYLEEKYPLCSNCKSMVQNVLSKQTLWLTHYKMLFFRQKPVKAVISNIRKSEAIFRVVSIIVDSIIAYNHDVIQHVWLPIGGLSFHLCACWASSMKKKNSDILLMFLWSCITILVLIKNLTTLQNIWLTAELITQYYMIIICASIIGFVTIKPSSYKSTLTGSVTFKKLKLHIQNTVLPESVHHNQNKNNVLNDMSNNTESPNNVSNELFSTEIKADPVILKQKLPTLTTNSNNNINPSNSVSSNKNNSDYRLNDSLNVLSTLSLSEDLPKYNAKVPTIFETRIYSTASCDLFKRSSTTLGRRWVLSPPKLQSVSWVAGGYWQDGMTSTPTLSRSSSQSSGFGSTGSNFAPSREPSVHEFDRCSVVSDVTQSYHAPRLNVNSMRPLCNSPTPRTQSRCSMYDATATTRNYSCSPLVSPVQTYGAAIAMKNHTQELIAPLAGGRNDSMPPLCSNHTTIVTSPSWLFALLGGSLILNIIVLCTMLLR